MFVRLLTAFFALTALLATAVSVKAQDDSAAPAPPTSIAIRGSLLATPDENPSAAPAADSFGSVSILAPDGRTLTLAEASLHGASYVWDDDNLPLGSYYIDTAGIVAPAGYTLLGLSGGMQDNGGYLVDLTAEAPNAYVFVAFLADEGSGEPIELDSDGDGLMDEVELEIGTDPNNPDSDGDALTDGHEVEIGTDPNDADTDDDGRLDGEEVQSLRPTNPFIPDTDGDGLTDGDEHHKYGTDPTYADPDGDGFDDGEEIAAGTDPWDPNSFPGAGEEERSTLVVDVRILPAEYDDNDFWGDSKPLQGVEVEIGIFGSEWGTRAHTGGNGQAVFEGLGEAEYVVALGVPGDAADFITVFGVEDGFEPRQHENQNTNHPVVYVGPDEVLYGTFYVIPVDAGAEPEPEPTKPGKPQPVKALPNTGTGAEADAEETTGSATLALILVGGLVVVGLVAIGRKRLA